MPRQSFRYFFDMSRAKSGALLGQFPAKLDFVPAAEWGRFTALCRWLNPKSAAEAEIHIQPLWHATAGAPYVEGLRVTARTDTMPTITADIPNSFFKPGAMRIGDALVDQKKLESGELFTYAVLAFPASDDQGARAPDPLEIEDVPVPTALTPGSINDELERSIAFGDVGSGLIPVFVPQGVIDEVLALTERAKNVEVGAVLIGQMHQDRSTQELFLKVTAQIPARHTLSESTRLSFTADTWAAAQAALDLRRSAEQIVGFFHNHPARYFCNKDCSPEAKEQCPFNTPFFSRADCDLHRVAFWQPHCIALLVTNTFSGMKLTMYGWDRAVITQRGFHIVKPDTARPLPVVEAASIIGTDIHETSCHP
jgi:proteasome lid subunit RPN8/RPN11